jgi:glyoxylase-like metal-dependent hydrolase (beta-lactamase superfamily II)
VGAVLSRRGPPRQAASIARVRVADRWFEHETVDDGVLRIREPHVDPFLQANLFLVRGRDRDLLVDTGLGIGSLRGELAELFERPTIALATHRHFDHTGGLHEFEEVVVHRDDAEAVANAHGFASLRIEEYPPEELSGYDPPASLLTALPREGFELGSYAVTPITPTRVVDEGDEIDLGDRTFRVLHLPGHTPGEIGLWEEATRTLFSGDCVYESGVLLDELPESNIADYVRSMRRLREVSARIVHGGHDDSFGRERLLELIEGYVRTRA